MEKNLHFMIHIGFGRKTGAGRYPHKMIMDYLVKILSANNFARIIMQEIILFSVIEYNIIYVYQQWRLTNLDKPQTSVKSQFKAKVSVATGLTETLNSTFLLGRVDGHPHGDACYSVLQLVSTANFCRSRVASSGLTFCWLFPGDVPLPVRAGLSRLLKVFGL